MVEGPGDPDDLTIPDTLPVLPLRDTVLFPNSFMPLAVARESSVRLIDEAISSGKLIGVFTQREASVEEPLQEELYPVGTATHIHKMFKLPDGSLRLIVQGVERITLDQTQLTGCQLGGELLAQEVGEAGIELDRGDRRTGLEQATGEQPEPRPDLEDGTARLRGGFGENRGENVGVGQEVLRQRVAGAQAGRPQRGPDLGGVDRGRLSHDRAVSASRAGATAARRDRGLPVRPLRTVVRPPLRSSRRCPYKGPGGAR